VLNHRTAVLSIALMLAGIGAIDAQTLAVSGNPGLLRISSAVAGSEPIPVSNATTTYTVVTGPPNRLYNITARLNAPMPAGVTLSVTLAPPPGATSLGAIALDATSRDVVTGVRRNTTATQGITYQLEATAAAGVVPNSSRTVTLTIVQAP
jgi:hypothetical protein